jgi:hypothetical protein
MSILLRILTLYIWVLGAGIILFLFFIARFYEKKYAELYRHEPKRKTYSRAFVVALLFFLISAGRYAFFLTDFAGDLGGDLAFFIGGLVLIWFAYHLQRMMTGGRE